MIYVTPVTWCRNYTLCYMSTSIIRTVCWSQGVEIIVDKKEHVLGKSIQSCTNVIEIIHVQGSNNSQDNTTVLLLCCPCANTESDRDGYLLPQTLHHVNVVWYHWLIGIQTSGKWTTLLLLQLESQTAESDKQFQCN